MTSRKSTSIKVVSFGVDVSMVISKDLKWFELNSIIKNIDRHARSLASRGLSDSYKYTMPISSKPLLKSKLTGESSSRGSVIDEILLEYNNPITINREILDRYDMLYLTRTFTVYLPDKQMTEAAMLGIDVTECIKRRIFFNFEYFEKYSNKRKIKHTQLSIEGSGGRAFRNIHLFKDIFPSLM